MNVPTQSVVVVVELTDKQLARVAAGQTVTKRVTLTVETKKAKVKV